MADGFETADLAHEDGAEPERRATGPEPSPGAVGPERAACDHVIDGAPVAGFVAAQVVVASGSLGSRLVDLCAECHGLAKQGLFVGVNHDRRRATRPPSSTVERSVSDRETQHGHPVPAVDSSSSAQGSTPAVASLPARDFGDHGHSIQPWDEHRVEPDRLWVEHRNDCPQCSQAPSYGPLCREGSALFAASTFYSPHRHTFTVTGVPGDE